MGTLMKLSGTKLGTKVGCEENQEVNKISEIAYCRSPRDNFLFPPPTGLSFISAISFWGVEQYEWNTFGREQPWNKMEQRERVIETDRQGKQCRVGFARLRICEYRSHQQWQSEDGGKMSQMCRDPDE